MKFNEIISDKDLLKAVDAMGFEQPSEIQEKVIPLLLEDQDVTGHAKTGTGKTAAFALPILQKMDYSLTSIQCLILVPTRELAKQVADEITRLGKYKKHLKTCVVYGGQSYTIQKKALAKKPNVLVATPGRLIDLLDRNYLDLYDVNYLVLDEADEMLSIGFAKELEKIEKQINSDRQTMLFSATFNDGVYKISKKYLTDPTKVSVVSKDKIADSIEQKYMLVKNNEKSIIISRLLTLHHDNMVMVFANTKKDVDNLVEFLQQDGIMAEAIHGDLTQKMRENVLSKFKKGIVKVLVCSDVAARGLDIKGVDVVINVDLPYEDEYYVHRVGRTGRANATGIAYSLISKNKERKIKQLARALKTTITPVPLILTKDIANIKNKVTLDKIENAIKNSNADSIIERINPLLKKGYDLDSVFYGLLALVFDEREEDVISGGEVRLFINLGKRDRFTKKDLVTLFNLDRDFLYDIDIKATFSFCTVTVDDVNKLIKKVNKERFNKKRISVEIANS